MASGRVSFRAAMLTYAVLAAICVTFTEGRIRLIALAVFGGLSLKTWIAHIAGWTIGSEADDISEMEHDSESNR